MEQQQETLALPAPSVDVDRLRSAIKKVMTGFGLKDVGLSQTMRSGQRSKILWAILFTALGLTGR